MTPSPEVERTTNLVIHVLRTIRENNIKLSVDAVSKVLTENPEIMEAACSGSEEVIAPAPSEDLSALKNEAERKEVFYKNALIALLSLAKKEVVDDGLSGALSFFKEEVISAAGLEDMEFALNSVINAEHNAQPVGPLSGLVSDSYAEELTEDCGEDSLPAVLVKSRQLLLDLLAGMDIELSEDYTRRVRSLLSKVMQCTDIEYLFALGKEAESVAQDFAQQVFAERRHNAKFIADALRSLTELNKLLEKTLGLSLQWQSSNDSFSNELEEQLTSMNDSVHNADDLKSLQDYVLDSLDTFKDALEKKREQDSSLKQNSNKELSTLRKQLSSLTNQMSKVQEENKTLMDKILIDGLTSIFNRLAFSKRIVQEVQKVKDNQGVASVIMLDLDHFKNINDTYGHTIGDKVLIETASRLKNKLRDTDFLARYGGEEFVAILPGATAEQAEIRADDLRQTIENTEFIVRGKRTPVTISCGVTQIQPEDASPEQSVVRADKALYEAKSAGRNRVAVV